MSMRGANYHSLAAVHHWAKAVAYSNAGFSDKAERHRRRARRHTAFGMHSGVDTVDLEHMLCTDSDRISNLMQRASELSAYTILSTMSDGNNASAHRIKPNDAEFSMIQKRSKWGNADSIVYEYLAGLSVNELACYYPCFPRTYVLSTDAGVPNEAREYADSPSLRTLGELISLGCTASDRLCVYTQYMPAVCSMDKFIEMIAAANGATQISLLHSLVSMMHILYTVLSSVAGVFTHYDLHTNNVGVVEIQGGVRVTAHTGDGHVSYVTRHMPVIWDFGRSFVDCTSIRPSLHSSDEIFRLVCDLDTNNYAEIIAVDEDDVEYGTKEPGGPCAKTCGDERGYRMWPSILADNHYRTAVFSRRQGGRGPEIYVSSETADLMLVNSVLTNRTLVAAVKAAAGSHAIYTTLSELMDAKNASSIHDMFSRLHSVVSRDAFRVLSGDVAYKHVHVWYGMCRHFSTEEAPVAHEEPAVPFVALGETRLNVGAVFSDGPATERDSLLLNEILRTQSYTALDRSASNGDDLRALESALSAIHDVRCSEIRAEHKIEEAGPFVTSVSGAFQKLGPGVLDMTYGSVSYTHGYRKRRMCFMARYERDSVCALAYSCGSRRDVVDTVDIHLDESGIVLRDLCAACDSLRLVISASVSCATTGDYAFKKEKYAALGFVQNRAKVRTPNSVVKQRTLIVGFLRTPGATQAAFGRNPARRKGRFSTALARRGGV